LQVGKRGQISLVVRFECLSAVNILGWIVENRVFCEEGVDRIDVPVLPPPPTNRFTTVSFCSVDDSTVVAPQFFRTDR
jgi:hypothetical protein